MRLLRGVVHWVWLASSLGCATMGCGGSQVGGEERDPPCPVPTPPSGEYSDVQVMGCGACALSLEGKLACWGTAYAGTTEPLQIEPNSGTLTQFSLSGEDACGLRADGAAYCWGQVEEHVPCEKVAPNEEVCQEGSLLPAASPPGSFSRIDLGVNICGIRVDGTLECWHGCGIRDGATECWPVGGPGEVAPPSGTFLEVGTDSGFTCALEASGIVTCWNTYVEDEEYAPPAPFGLFRTISVGMTRMCGVLEDGSVACFGSYAESMQYAVHPGQFERVSTSLHRVCATMADGGIRCWNHDGTTKDYEGNFVTVSAADDYWCAVRTDGTLTCEH